MDSSPQTPFSFTIQIGGESLSVSGALPLGKCAVREMLPLLLGLGEGIVAAAVRQIPAGRAVSCGPGCGACCRQLVPISLSEADFLIHQVLPNLKKSHRKRVTQRIADAAASLLQAGLLDKLRQLPLETDPERRQAVGLRYFLQRLPCPFLENESCSIHPQRPLACREYLVSSAPSRCAQPDHGGVLAVPLPQKPSHALIQLDATATGSAGWQTMITALLDKDDSLTRIIPQPGRILEEFPLPSGKIRLVARSSCVTAPCGCRTDHPNQSPACLHSSI
jgi:Fe-S-cluster containining protein